MISVFQKIINGELSAHVVAEDENCMAILDINPKEKGHVICFSKKSSEDHFFNMKDNDYSEIMLFVKKVSNTLYLALKPKRVGMIVAGFDVPHAHIHLIPCNRVESISLTKSGINISPVEMENIAKELRNFFEK